MNFLFIIIIVIGLIYVIIELFKAELNHQQYLQNQKDKSINSNDEKEN